MATDAVADYFIVAFPEISEKALRWIQTIREMHDPNAHLIAPHFTLGFSIRGPSDDALASHMNALSLRATSIRFHCRHVTLGHDHASAGVYAFLVPEEGASEISDLRCLLHTGILAEHLRPDIAFTPHITLAAGASAVRMQMLCDDLNDQAPSIGGAINSLTLVRRSSGAVEDICSTLLPKN